MKYSLDTYTEALFNALDETEPVNKDKVLSNFVRILDKNGDIRYRDRIIESVHKRAVKRNGGKWVIVEVARELPEPRQRIIREIFSENDFVGFSVNSALLAGIRITIDGEQELDASLNKKLKMVLGA